MIRQEPSLLPNKYQQEQMDRKFGMFIHFGVNTFGNVEWSDGMIQALSYKPTEIDADQWVRTAYEAGMNYVIIDYQAPRWILPLGYKIHRLLRKKFGE